jgi:site-specific recombinase XerD
MFSQSKTGTVIRHKILPHVGNALAEYILNERIGNDSALLFLKSNGDGLSSKTISGVVRNGFLSSGIDIGARKYGSHSLRHSAASALINEGHSIFSVANVLGQTSAATARLYAKVDFSRLSACALEVPVYE